MRAVVRRVDRLSGSMVRVVLGGGDLHRFQPVRQTDSYVKLIFQHPQAPFVEHLDLAARDQLPAEQRPRLRAYTVRHWDADRRELSLDVVLHGDRGLAGPWAATARPGDLIHLTGPGGGYAPDPQAAWHLLAGDPSALPAIAVAADQLPPDVPAWVLVEVDGPGDEIELTAPAASRVSWLHRAGRPVGQALTEAVTALPRPDGDGQAFVHGEAGFVRELRRLLRVSWGVPRGRLSASGYWRLGADDEGWRAGKRAWAEQVEDDERAAGLAAP
jgi:NADPH-dependent ferric siderophore reductase